MVLIPGYRVGEILYEGYRTLVYRGVSLSDNKPVVIKLQKQEYPTFNELVQYRNQYAITKHLDVPGIVKPISLVSYRNGYALILEDIGAVSLKQYVNAKQLELGEILQIVISVAQTLEELYHHRIIHKDIKPQNIIIHPVSGEVRLIDFSIASPLPKERQEIHNPKLLEGTLAYMSPEQTGRMNRGIDYRTDFYSMGVTFYELLTGKLPFQSNDPIELVHCHIAKQPIPPCQINPDIPQIVSDIAIALMAKTAEQRYQSACGLKHDLEVCRQQYAKNGKISRFSLRTRDLCDRFTIPEKLYGRQPQVQQLLAAFERVSAGSSEMILVRGFSGIGKTAVVNEIHKPILRQRGYFIKGKFDQFKRNIPFSALVQAFSGLVVQLLTETTAAAPAWKAKILEATGDGARVIIDVIPELELLIGKQPPVPELEPSAAQNRFNLLLQKFIRVFPSADHPLVIFLDDLQWADPASLKLLKLLMSDAQNKYLLFVGAYRDNEVHATHPLALTLEEIEKTEAKGDRITLKPLDEEAVNHLIADTLCCSPELAVPLTELVYRKTRGNPFFATQFLNSLHTDGLIYFNENSRYWQCDLARVMVLSLTDDVVEFMALQLQKLPAQTQNVLKLAACIGNQFDLETLALICERSAARTAADLWSALQTGLIIPINEIYKFFADPSTVSNREQPTIPYKFLHDRVQQAAYFLIPEDQKQATHLKIGQRLLKNTNVEERDEKIFDIVNHLNYGLELITSPAERYELARLNLAAGQKAKASTAYKAAGKYLAVGRELLAVDCWKTQYELTLALYGEAAEADYLSTDFEGAASLIEVVLKRGKTLIDKVRVYDLKMQLEIAQLQTLKAVETGLYVLKKLGVILEQSPPENFAFEEAIALPEMTDPQQLAALRMLMKIVPAAYAAQPALLPQIIFTMIRISLHYGNSAAGAYGYVIYALLLCGPLENINLGYRYGELALRLLDKLNARSVKAKVLDAFYGQVKHWKAHVRETIEPLVEALQSGLETGDLEFAGYCAVKSSTHLFFAGESLDRADSQIGKYIELMQQLKQDYPTQYQSICRQIVQNLLGKTDNPLKLIGEAFNEDEIVPIFQAANNATALFFVYLAKTILFYFLKEPKLAIENAIAAEQYIDANPGLISVGQHNFYYSLALLDLAHQGDRNVDLDRIYKNQEKMKNWADSAPMNFQHKYDLVEAEKARLLGKKLEAMELYDRAISGAKENAYIQEEAIANELAATFYFNWGRQTIARTYLTQAYYGYARWGAKAKIEDLQKRYHQLLSPISIREKRQIFGNKNLANPTGNAVTNTSCGSDSLLDFSSILKASQALSETLNIEQLLSRLMQVVMENEGATKSAIILPQSGELTLAAIAISNSDDGTLFPSIPISQSRDIPLSIINLVERTIQPLVIDNAIAETRFVGDPYTVEYQPQSILCAPLLYQGKLMGILYLENNLTTGAFTRERLQVLNIFTTQAAISLENAILYASLEEKVASRTQELNEKNQYLAQALQELRRTQIQLIQTEKMSSLGQMVAGVAHEINNPISFIYGNTSHARSHVENLLDLVAVYQEEYPVSTPRLDKKNAEIDLDFLREDLQQILNSMQGGAERIVNIVQSLRSFSRLDEARMKPVDIHAGINSTLAILQNRLRKQGNRPEIKAIEDYGKLPQVNCYASELNQVFMNILSNAIDALDEAWNEEQNFEPLPTITIRTEVTDANFVKIGIADNGPGMTEQVRQKIFDPFFTTKPVGAGTGLGLSISYSIVVDKHGGTLTCNSLLGRGTEFIIELPHNRERPSKK